MTSSISQEVFLSGVSEIEMETSYNGSDFFGSVISIKALERDVPVAIRQGLRSSNSFHTVTRGSSGRPFGWCFLRCKPEDEDGRLDRK